eukprot:jgi/Mesvir1/27630/Mv07361-RA.1
MVSTRLPYCVVLLLAAWIAGCVPSCDGKYDYCGPGVMPAPEEYEELPLESAKLLLVQMVARHGDRAPVTPLPQGVATWHCPATEVSIRVHDRADDAYGTYGSSAAGEWPIAGGTKEGLTAEGSKEGVASEGTEEGPASSDSADLSRHAVMNDLTGGCRASMAVRQVVDTSEDATWPFTGRMWNGSCNIGQLTARGHQQLRALGASVRALYADKLGLLPADIQPSDVYVRATDTPRTQQSAQAFLEGLKYPPPSLPVDVTPRHRHQNTFVIHTLPSRVETLTPNFESCPELARPKSTRFDSAAWKGHMEETYGLLRYMEARTGISSRTGQVGAQGWRGPFYPYFDIIQSHTCHGMPLPCTAKKDEVNEELMPAQALADTGATSSAATSGHCNPGSRAMAPGSHDASTAPLPSSAAASSSSSSSSSSYSSAFAAKSSPSPFGASNQYGCVSRDKAKAAVRAAEWEARFHYAQYDRLSQAPLQIGGFVATLRDVVLRAVACANASQQATVAQGTSRLANTGGRTATNTSDGSRDSEEAGESGSEGADSSGRLQTGSEGEKDSGLAGPGEGASSQGRREDESMPRLRYYQGHDATIAALLGSLGQQAWRWPPYASHLVLELWSTPAGKPNATTAQMPGIHVTPLVTGSWTVLLVPT